MVFLRFVYCSSCCLLQFSKDSLNLFKSLITLEFVCCVCFFKLFLGDFCFRFFVLKIVTVLWYRRNALFGNVSLFVCLLILCVDIVFSEIFFVYEDYFLLFWYALLNVSKISFCFFSLTQQINFFFVVFWSMCVFGWCHIESKSPAMGDSCCLEAFNCIDRKKTSKAFGCLEMNRQHDLLLKIESIDFDCAIVKEL